MRDRPAMEKPRSPTSILESAAAAVALVVGAQSAHGLKCKAYGPTLDNAAAKGDMKSPTTKCTGVSATLDAVKGTCYTEQTCSAGQECFRTSYKMPVTGKDSINGGCSLPAASMCPAVQAAYKGIKCASCSTELCNSGGMLKPSLGAALLAVLSVLGFLV